MTGRVTGGKALPSEVVEQIVTKTDGVPLFVEELTKMVLESGLLREGEERYALTGPLPPLAIPATLHDSLMARLDRLATVKDVAQLGATIGRTFAYELLQAVSPLDEATLQHGLRQFVEAELVYQRGVPPQATYTFKHALIQDAAYQSLLRSTRQQYHQRLAQVLAEQFPETAETQPELLAHHYTEAGLSAAAIPYWQQAGQQPSSARPMWKQSVTSPRGWRCSRLCRIRPSAPSTNSRCRSLWVCRCRLLRAGVLRAWDKPTPGHGNSVGKVGDTPQLFLGVDRTVGVLCSAIRAQNGAGAGGAAPAPGSKCAGSRSSPRSPPMRLATSYYGLERLRQPTPTWSKGLPSTIRSNTAPISFSTGMIPGCGAGSLRPGLCGISATRTRPSREATKR